MLVDTTTEHCLVPETSDGPTAENNSENEGDPPANHNASRDDGNNGKTSDRK